MFHFYVLSFFKKGDTIQGRTLFKEIQTIKVTKPTVNKVKQIQFIL